MVLDQDKMDRQTRYETKMHYLHLLFEKGLLTKTEYREELFRIESETNPIIAHNPLLYKEKE